MPQHCKKPAGRGKSAVPAGSHWGGDGKGRSDAGLAVVHMLAVSYLPVSICVFVGAKNTGQSGVLKRGRDQAQKTKAVPLPKETHHVLGPVVEERRARRRLGLQGPGLKEGQQEAGVKVLCNIPGPPTRQCHTAGVKVLVRS